ncbi:MAG: pyridoxal phosphate-dependent aminotransferase family protein [bacterium]
MFKIPIFTEKRNPVTERCLTDATTKLRLKYAPYYHVVEKAEGAHVWVDGRKMVMMSSNEYLGLSSHPKIKQAVRDALEEWGGSPCGSRLANGSRKYHIELEEDLAAFLGKEACHVIVAGYMACIASLAAIAQRDDALIVDKSIHSSLWDGARLSAATMERFSHEDMASLQAMLEQLEPGQPKIIAVDGVYSMEGHIASLPKIVELAKKFSAFLVVDDAHGFGVLGKDGRGVADHCGVAKDVGLIVGTFSKSLASTGGFIAGDRGVIEYLRSNCRQIIFSAAIAAPAAAAARAALRVMQEEPEHRERLWENTRYLQNILKNLGLDYWDSPTPAIPIVIGNQEKCYGLWKHLWEHGFFTVISISPGVPVGKDLVRTAVSALHTKEQLDRFGEALQAGIKRVGIKTLR